MIWIIPAAIAALSFFKLGSLYVWVHVMTLVIRVLVVVCLLLLTGGTGFLWVRMRKR